MEEIFEINFVFPENPFCIKFSPAEGSQDIFFLREAEMFEKAIFFADPPPSNQIFW